MRLQNLLRTVLNIPDTHEIALLNGGCTGAIEAALWNLLGPRAVDVLAWDVFGLLWLHDVRQELGLEGQDLCTTDGRLPDLSAISPDHDVVFTWNGSTTGVCVPNSDWISDERSGLTLCDAASAAFAYDLPWDKLDATAFSLQKGLGGEGGLGVLVLSPRAIERLHNHQPTWSIPRLLRLRDKDRVFTPLFEGKTLNTPSMLVLEDGIHCLEMALKNGGLSTLIQRSRANLDTLSQWIDQTPGTRFVAKSPETRSRTTMCFQITGHENWEALTPLIQELEGQHVAYDIKGHGHDVPCVRIWGGPTVESQDIKECLRRIEELIHKKS